MKVFFVLLAVLMSTTATLAGVASPTPEQLRSMQLRLNEQQQQLNQLRLRQPPALQRDQQLQSLQSQLEQQQIELQRLKMEQQGCTRGRC